MKSEEIRTLLAAPLMLFSQKPSPMRAAATTFAASRPQAMRAARCLGAGPTPWPSTAGGVQPILSSGSTTDDWQEGQMIVPAVMGCPQWEQGVGVLHAPSIAEIRPIQDFLGMR